MNVMMMMKNAMVKMIMYECDDDVNECDDDDDECDVDECGDGVDD